MGADWLGHHFSPMSKCRCSREHSSLATEDHAAIAFPKNTIVGISRFASMIGLSAWGKRALAYSPTRSV
jgi:hypothetical protein